MNIEEGELKGKGKSVLIGGAGTEEVGDTAAVPTSSGEVPMRKQDV